MRENCLKFHIISSVLCYIFTRFYYVSVQWLAKRRELQSEQTFLHVIYLPFFTPGYVNKLKIMREEKKARERNNVNKLIVANEIGIVAHFRFSVQN